MLILQKSRKTQLQRVAIRFLLDLSLLNFADPVSLLQEHAIEARLMHIVHAIEHKEWPVSVNFSAGEELDIPQNEKDCSEVITITTDHGVSRSIASGNNISASKKRKRHIAIDVETERGNFNVIACYPVVQHSARLAV